MYVSLIYNVQLTYWQTPCCTLFKSQNMSSTLSKKRESKLYSEVHEEVMKARIEVAHLLNDMPTIGNKIDDIFYKLTINAPKKAIEVFYKN